MAPRLPEAGVERLSVWTSKASGKACAHQTQGGSQLGRVEGRPAHTKPKAIVSWGGLMGRILNIGVAGLSMP